MAFLSPNTIRGSQNRTGINRVKVCFLTIKRPPVGTMPSLPAVVDDVSYITKLLLKVVYSLHDVPHF